MALGMAPAQANKMLDAVNGNATFTVIANDPYIKLHLGDPGAAGTSNPATETTRKQVSMGAASGGICLNDASITWTSYPAAEDPTHFSAWDHVSAGNFLYSGTITANTIGVGDSYQVAVGGLSTQIAVAA